MERLHRVGDVAGLTGVSIRTLHHYDRIGLLKPAGYSDGGHRLYSEAELLRLQQILTLRYLGFSLARIGELLERPDFDLVASLRAQQQALRDRRSELEQVEGALNELLDRRLASGNWDWTLVTRLARAVHDHLYEKGRTMERYYTPEQMQRFAELGERMPDGEIQAIETGWVELIRDVRAGTHLDPASPEAQDLVRRWDGMHARTRQAYDGYEDLWDQIGENYAAGSFEGHPEAPSQTDIDFIERARGAGSR